MKKKLKKLKSLIGDSDLRKDVAIWIEEKANDYESLESVFNDLFQGGCVSGIVSHLIYYSDTVSFYNNHESEIWDLLNQQSEDFGYSNPIEFLATFQGCNNVGDGDQFKNLLAWYAFEETARILANEIGIEV